MKISVFWFRRDLRIEDNTALFHALNSGFPVLPVFIFDNNIINELKPDDARISFIYKQLNTINSKLEMHGCSLKIIRSNPFDAFEQLIKKFEILGVYSNRDYEPYAMMRDAEIENLLKEKAIHFHQFKDQVIYEKNEILKANGVPYTIYTPYKNQWLKKFSGKSPEIKLVGTLLNNLLKHTEKFPAIEEIGFRLSIVKVRDYILDDLVSYPQKRDIPSIDGTSFLGPHLRFGTISVRQIINQLSAADDVFLSELIWREFFMQILAHFPRVVNENFKTKYNNIHWLNQESDFERWCIGETGYPMVDAGMKQLNETGFMHNRVRMVTASFLCKHLLIDWRWGEAYFAQKLLDYELSSNNGNWQWAAGTGCDAAPYFRVFNPLAQQERFDSDFVYIRKWLKEFETPQYPKPIVDHSFARQRAIEVYQKGLSTIL
jgi:deoxyribodipyrimidine photo-lyase